MADSTPSESNQTAPAGQRLARWDRVGPLEILGVVGAGASSVVYKAHDATDARFVAIKHVRLSNPEQAGRLAKRIRREIADFQNITNTNARYLAQPVDVVEDPRGLMLVRDFIDGPSLDDMLNLAPTPMDPQQAMGIVAATALGLEVIHAARQIHGDLKPSNILLPRSGGVKITDYGLPDTLAIRTLTNVQSVRYMAPELIRGKNVDGRADLYALGVIAYEMLAGRPKFSSTFDAVMPNTNHARSWIRWHTNPKAAAPPLGSVLDSVPPQISELVQRLMEKDPARRPASVKDLVDAIGHRGGRPAPDAPGSPQTRPTGAVGPPPSPPEARVTRRRHPLVGIMAAMLAVWVLVGLGLGLHVVISRTSAHQTLVDGRTAYEQEDFTTAQQLYQRVATDWPASSRHGREGRLRALLSQARIHLARGRYSDARASFEEAAALGAHRDQMAGGLINEVETAKDFCSALDRVRAHINQHNFEEAETDLAAAFARNPVEYIETELMRLSHILEDQQSQVLRQSTLVRAQELVAAGRRGGAIDLLARSLRHSPNSQVQDEYDRLVAEQTIERAVDRGKAAESAGNVDEAIIAYSEALATRANEQLSRKLAGLQSRSALEEGLKLLSAGDTAAAEAALARSLGFEENEAARKALERIDSANRQLAFARAAERAAADGEHETAVKQFENALALGGPDTRGLAQKLTEARVRLLVQRATEALDAGETALAQKLLESATKLSPDHALIATATEQLAVRTAYNRLLAAGDEDRAASRFGAAKLNYLRAAELRPTDEIRQRLDETEYDQLVTQALGYMAREQYLGAKALLRTAAEIRRTEQIDALLAEVERYVPTLPEED